jgi:biliverdin reductase
LIDLLGPVRSVAAQVRYVPEAPLDFFQSCFAQAQLEFVAGAIAEVGYHKGEHCWSAQRTLEICGTHGQIRFEGEQGTLITADDPPQSLEAKSPRGLFQQDTEAVCRHLCQGQPLYVGQQSILRAIATAEAAETAAQTRTVVAVPQV